MKPYGVKRNSISVEDVKKDRRGGKSRYHSTMKKLYHRIARRHFKHMTKRTRGCDLTSDKY